MAEALVFQGSNIYCPTGNSTVALVRSRRKYPSVNDLPSMNALGECLRHSRRSWFERYKSQTLTITGFRPREPRRMDIFAVYTGEGRAGITYKKKPLKHAFHCYIGASIGAALRGSDEDRDRVTRPGRTTNVYLCLTLEWKEQKNPFQSTS